MEAKLEKIENSEAYIAIEVDAEKFEEGLEKAYRKVVKQVGVPGFRKGRVPRPLLEAHYGKEILYQDALEVIVPEAYEEALEQLNINALAQPEFDIDEIEDGKPFKFQARVAVKPEFELGNLEGLEVSIPYLQVTDQDVDNRLEEMRSRYAEISEKTEEPAEIGDTLEIDFEGFIDGEAFSGGQGSDYPLELGSNTFIPGFEDQLVGLKVGESKDVQVTFPEDYHAEDLAGKEAIFKVEIKKIETKKMRDLDDDFAQEVSSFDSLAELREDVKTNLEEMTEKRKQEFIKQEVLVQALGKCDIPAADSVVNVQLDRMLEQFGQRMAAQGLSLEQYFQFTGSNPEAFYTELRPEAERIVKTNFMLEKIVEEKGFTISDEEMNKQIENMAKDLGLELEKAKETLTNLRDELEQSMKVDKAIKYLADNAVITEKTEENTKDANEVETGE
ncbi:MAG TPA: trigger factor [Syntrophomonas sp.]|nr:trigger factor [Syntrophomonas sp.]